MALRLPFLVVSGLLLVLDCTACAGSHELARSTPEAEGISAQVVLNFIEALESELDSPHGIVLVRHGKVVADGWWSPFERDRQHVLYSLSKSFTSTAVGMAVDEGLLTVDDKVLSFFPEDGPAEPSDNLKAMRVRDLLTMTTGHARDTMRPLMNRDEENWPKVFLSLPVEHEPGTHFLYNTGATYMLSAICQKATVQSVLEYLTPRLFEPLGIKNPRWETDPRGVNAGGWGLRVTTGDIAKFGQLYLQKGMWNGKRLLSEAWVDTATSFQVPNGDNPDNDWNQGYGYQFWMCRGEGIYRGDGLQGQFCIVMPKQDAVVAMNSGFHDLAKAMNLVWEHLLPAMGDAPLEADKSAQRALAEKMRTLSQPVPQGKAASPLAAKLSDRRFAFEENNAGVKAVRLEFGEDSGKVVIESETLDQTIEFSHGRWREQSVAVEDVFLSIRADGGVEPAAAAGAWASDNELSVTTWLNETTLRMELKFIFDPDEGKVQMKRRFLPIERSWTTFEGKSADAVATISPDEEE